jgi:hypothetical protein
MKNSTARSINLTDAFKLGGTQHGLDWTRFVEPSSKLRKDKKPDGWLFKQIRKQQ